jgi:hypothetical protein
LPRLRRRTDRQGAFDVSRTLSVIFLVIAVALCAGCPGTSERYFKGVLYELPADERVTVRHAEAEDIFEFKSLTLHVLVDHDVLQVNDRTYGTVTRGDQVEVTRSGKVLVNGKERSPVASP